MSSFSSTILLRSLSSPKFDSSDDTTSSPLTEGKFIGFLLIEECWRNFRRNFKSILLTFRSPMALEDLNCLEAAA